MISVMIFPAILPISKFLGGTSLSSPFVSHYYFYFSPNNLHLKVSAPVYLLELFNASIASVTVKELLIFNVGGSLVFLRFVTV